MLTCDGEPMSTLVFLAVGTRISSAALWLSPVSRSFAHLNYMRPNVLLLRLMMCDHPVAGMISGFLISFGIFRIFGKYLRVFMEPAAYLGRGTYEYAVVSGHGH